jgi:hypothetical protein
VSLDAQHANLVNDSTSAPAGATPAPASGAGVAPVDPSLASATIADGQRFTAGRAATAAACLFAGSLIACLLMYLVIVVQGAWISSVRSEHFAPSQMTVSKGSGSVGAQGLVLTAPDASGTTVVSLSTSLRSSRYLVVAWSSSGVPDNVEVALLWHNDYAPSRIFNRRLAVEAGRIQPYALQRDPDWNGTIDGLALGIKGAYAQPIVISGVSAKTMTAGDVLGDRVREWLTFEPWSGSSINLIIGGSDVQELPLPFLLGMVLLLSALVYAALKRFRPRWAGAPAALVLAAIFVAGWLIIDARLQLNLARQARVTAQTYAGKSWRDRHLAAEDSMVFAFIEKVRAKLPPPPARVFMVGDEHYFRDRGAYHLYPYNVWFPPWTNTMPASGAMHSGDYLVVFQRGGVQFDAANQSLRWEGNSALRAELVYIEGGAALFRIL